MEAYRFLLATIFYMTVAKAAGHAISRVDFSIGCLKIKLNTVDRFETKKRTKQFLK